MGTVGMSVKGRLQGAYGNGTVLYLDCNGSYTNIHMRYNCIGQYTYIPIHTYKASELRTNCSNVIYLLDTILQLFKILPLGKQYIEHSCTFFFFLQLPVNP